MTARQVKAKNRPKVTGGALSSLPSLHHEHTTMPDSFAICRRHPGSATSGAPAPARPPLLAPWSMSDGKHFARCRRDSGERPGTRSGRVPDPTGFSSRIQLTNAFSPIQAESDCSPIANVMRAPEPTRRSSMPKSAASKAPRVFSQCRVFRVSCIVGPDARPHGLRARGATVGWRTRWTDARVEQRQAVGPRTPARVDRSRDRPEPPPVNARCLWHRATRPVRRSRAWRR